FTSHELGKKWITTVFVRISSFSPDTVPALAGANWTSYSFFCDAYFGSAASFWMIEKSITWSNGVCSVIALMRLLRKYAVVHVRSKLVGLFWFRKNSRFSA